MKEQTPTRQKEFVNKWKTSFRKFIGIRGMPEDTLKLRNTKIDIRTQTGSKRGLYNNLPFSDISSLFYIFPDKPDSLVK